MVAQLKKDNLRIWYDAELLNEPAERVFDIEFWQQNEAVIGSAKGRGTTWFVQTQTIQAALRHYRRGGLFGKIVSDQYWFSGWENTRSYAEFKLLQSLAEAGVNVPRPIAARVQRSGLIYRADLLSEKIVGANDLVNILEKQSLNERQYQAIGREIAKMHQAQVNHTDLNIHNLLLDKDDRVWIIDFDKCCKQAGSDWQQNNLDRLLRSFLKEQNKRSIHWQEDEFNHLLAGYKSI
ncbi:3-deoxy-D-manno-octulosonic acid kinase [Vibrio sp. YIC-376]|uniref:3-deoxy-D-manno-octulosonic acid kinase n=1 Tax=Vibrio sp. YIC-376 TaxID=3136162 RepID=UPI00402AE640